MLEEALRSLTSQKVQPQILVHDNCEMGSAEVVCRKFPRVRYQRNSANLGALGNFASLVNACETPYFGWLQDDDVLFPSWVETMLSAMKLSPSLGCVLSFSIQVKSMDRIDRQASTIFGPPGFTDWAGGSLHTIPRYGMIPWALIRYCGFSPSALYLRHDLQQALDATSKHDFGIFWERAIIAAISSNSEIGVVPSVNAMLRCHAASASNAFMKESVEDCGAAYLNTQSVLERFLSQLCEEGRLLPQQYFNAELENESEDALTEFLREAARFRTQFAQMVCEGLRKTGKLAVVAGELEAIRASHNPFALTVKRTLREIMPPVLLRLAKLILR